MTWYLSLSLLIGLIMSMMLVRIPIAFAFLLTNLIGVFIFMGGHFGVVQMAANMTSALTRYSFVPIPLFLLMGELFFHTGIAKRVFSVVDGLLGNVRGRLAYVSVAGGTIFASLSGSSLANVAMMGSSMYPEMERRNYKPIVSLGPIIATGGLAAVIPPSGLAVLLGSLAGLNIGQLLLAGFLPGVILALLYAAFVFGWTFFDRDAAPAYDVEPLSLREKLRLTVTDLLPMLSIILMVVGLIIFGIATPTESATFGVVGVVLVAALFRSLTVEAIVKSAIGAMRITAMIFMIILTSTTFSQLLAISGATSGLIGWTQSFDAPPVVILMLIGLLLLLMGAFMEPVGIMMVTLPILFPLVVSVGTDPIWFAVFMLIFIEVGLCTPPIGLALFVMLGVTKNKTLADVSVAVAPYLLITVLFLAVTIFFPQIMLALPSLMQ